MKIKLLHNPQYWSNLTAFFLEEVWDKWFDVIPIDPTQEYSPADCIVFSNFLTADRWIQPWLDRGFKVVVDHTWDAWVVDQWVNRENILVIRNEYWCWYNESLWYRALNYYGFSPAPTADRTFLMLMNLPRPHRDLIYAKLKDLLPTAIYSYHGIGQPLVGGLDQDSQLDTWQRYINPDWFNRTRFSVVVETDITPYPLLALSEKTFKPMAFKHPTISWAGPGLLQHLKNRGFATFDHIFDESYDKIENATERLNAVVNLIRQTVTLVNSDTNYLKDTETLNRIEHNYNHFYNKQLVLKYFYDEIVCPILEFSCKR